MWYCIDCCDSDSMGVNGSMNGSMGANANGSERERESESGDDKSLHTCHVHKSGDHRMVIQLVLERIQYHSTDGNPVDSDLEHRSY